METRVQTEVRSCLLSNVVLACAQCVLSLAFRRSVRLYDVTPYFTRAAHGLLLCHVTTTTTPTSTLTSSACLEVICISYGAAITRCRSSAPFGTYSVSYVECCRVSHPVNFLVVFILDFPVLRCECSDAGGDTVHYHFDSGYSSKGSPRKHSS